jgi:tripeptidyl-peptidase-2
LKLYNYLIVYDSNNKVITHLDVYPKKIKFEKKGDYIIRMHLTSEYEDILEKLRATILHLDISLPKAISFLTHKDIADVYKSEKSTCTKMILDKGDYKVCYIAAPHDHSTYPKEAKVGDALVGKLNFTAEKVDGGQYKTVYFVPAAPSDNPTPQVNDKEDESELQKKMLDAIKDLQISYLKKYPAGSETRKKLVDELEKVQGDYIPYSEYKLETLVNSDTLLQPATNTSNAAEAIKVATSILDKIDLKALAEYFGVRDENKTAKRKQLRKENEKKKQTALNALRGKCIALSVLLDSEPNNSEYQQDFETAFSQLQQWSDGSAATSSDLSTLLLYVARERRANRLGTAVKALNKFISDSSDVGSLNKVYKLRQELFKDLDWQIWCDYDTQWALIRCPPTGFAPF